MAEKSVSPNKNRYESSESGTKPTEVTDIPFIRCFKDEITKKYEADMQKGAGKWLMFIDKWEIDEKWKQCCDLYQAGKLNGIYNIKSSTNQPKPRKYSWNKSYTQQYVIMFYCGPADDEKLMLEYGQNILKYIPYKKNFTYKSDEQTARGTRNTGQKKNHLYRINPDIDLQDVAKALNEIE